MYNYNVREKIKSLRSKGLTYKEITEKIGMSVPKSTISHWCKNVKLPRFYAQKVEKLNRRNMAKGRQIAFSSLREKQKQFLKNLEVKNQILVEKFQKDSDIKKIALSVLYLGEGSKWKTHRGLMLGSSDPNIINLYIGLLKHIYLIPKSNLHARISYRADQDIKKLTTYWSGVAGLSKKQFYKTKPDPRTVGKITKNKKYKGVCAITCAGTKIQLELETISRMIASGPVA